VVRLSIFALGFVVLLGGIVGVVRRDVHVAPVLVQGVILALVLAWHAYVRAGNVGRAPRTVVLGWGLLGVFVGGNLGSLIAVVVWGKPVHGAGAGVTVALAVIGMVVALWARDRTAENAFPPPNWRRSPPPGGRL
jgi:hypothetical protein